ncbi:hypothetical protein HYS29_00670 [Candidatus Microgenomates bacterium]|nr:hypothetical protein [Candidatus Microgenomates bacterium]
MMQREDGRHTPPIDLLKINEDVVVGRKPEVLVIPLEGNGYIKFSYSLGFDDNRLPQPVTVSMGSSTLTPDYEVEYMVPGTVVTGLHQIRQRHDGLQQKLTEDPKFQEDFGVYKDCLSASLRYQLAGNLLEAVSRIDEVRQPIERERAMTNRIEESLRVGCRALRQKVGALENGSDLIRYLLGSGDDILVGYGLFLVQNHLAASLQEDLQRVWETEGFPGQTRRLAFSLLYPEAQRRLTRRPQAQV